MKMYRSCNKEGHLSDRVLYEDVYEKKFSFGKNWKIYLKSLSEYKISLAQKSLSDFTGLNNFKNKTFLDFGCGSGLFSLAAQRQGAKKVVSVDIDEYSIDCAKYLRDRYKVERSQWVIKKGSVLDNSFIKRLGTFDIVYSWGVLHHTGNMWAALDSITSTVDENGLLYLAIYNDFRGLPLSSEKWVGLKEFYSKSNLIFRRLMEYTWGGIIIVGLVLHRRSPLNYIKNYDCISQRGMYFMSDIRDWLGGWPYEFASKDKIKDFYLKRGLILKNMSETKREGCNEYLFRRA
jgi:2-polyprenyl-6-hydroxyphenyl methylase/3-demethylubiquinone-9 3-methyltransferase